MCQFITSDQSILGNKSIEHSKFAAQFHTGKFNLSEMSKAQGH